MTVVNFAVWEEGIVLAPGNPRGIRTESNKSRLPAPVS
jgi:hypothetical protein